MIALVRGLLIMKAPQYAIIDVNGIGYKVFIPLSTFPKLPSLKEEVTFHTYTHVREDVIQLYGFLTDEERDFFVMLLTISGIGPRMGMNILSGASLPDLIETVDKGDANRLSMIPGVGKKTAARIILELKEKLVPMGTFSGEGKLNTRIEADALSALTNLGYNRAQANEAIKMACNISRNMSLEEVIREALRNLGKGGG